MAVSDLLGGDRLALNHHRQTHLGNTLSVEPLPVGGASSANKPHYIDPGRSCRLEVSRDQTGHSIQVGSDCVRFESLLRRCGRWGQEPAGLQGISTWAFWA